MFINAIEEIQNFTRPVHTIIRHYHNDFIQPGAATLFFVNEDGVAITCKHVLEMVLQEHSINEMYTRFKEERKLLGSKIDGKYKKKLAELETKYHYTPKESIVQFRSSYINCTDSSTYDYVLHPTLDIALIKFKNVTKNFYSSYGKFMKDGTHLKQGKNLCRFGFPFAEFTNYLYDTVNDEIVFTSEGNLNSPSFPLDGILTRHVSDGQKIVGIEVSSPGLKGQSGGPLFDVNGTICGMQSQTVQYHMGLDDQKIEILSKGKKTSIINHSFLNVGRCIHVDAIKEFLIVNNIKFYEQ